MAIATLLADVGPCDDDGFLYINGNEVVSVTLNKTRRYQRELADGSYNFRLKVVNSGAFAWAARLRLIVNGVELTTVQEAGATFLFNGIVYDKEWQCRIVDGQVSEFGPVPVSVPG